MSRKRLAWLSGAPCWGHLTAMVCSAGCTFNPPPPVEEIPIGATIDAVGVMEYSAPRGPITPVSSIYFKSPGTHEFTWMEDAPRTGYLSVNTDNERGITVGMSFLDGADDRGLGGESRWKGFAEPEWTFWMRTHGEGESAEALALLVWKSDGDVTPGYERAGFQADGVEVAGVSTSSAEWYAITVPLPNTNSANIELAELTIAPIRADARLGVDLAGVFARPQPAEP